MKLKYFLRGLGMGVLVTALIMTISGNASRKVSLTEEEIIKRAEQLGMVMEDDSIEGLDNLSSTEDLSVSGESAKPENPGIEDSKKTAEPEESKEPSESSQPKESPKPSQSSQPEESEKPKESKKPDRKITFVIKAGMSSGMIATALENAGLIDDAKAFDEYMCDKGYDSKISTGTYEIPDGADYDRIIDAITK